MSRLDPHSYADPAQGRTRHLSWKLSVDFASRTLDGDVTLELEAPSPGGPLDLDTKGLTLHAVESTDGAPLRHQLGDEEPILGQRLRIELPAGARGVRIRYRTSPDALALQWLEPAQTEGKRHPFLFSQCQAIHARSMVPVQDTPRLRITYHAEVTVPAPLSAVMSAGPAGSPTGPGAGPGAAARTFAFDMPQPIPPYLIALAVGELDSRELGPRSRVWAEPATIERAAWEFAGIEDTIAVAERLFGPYDWERYDMLVLPPSFPYGGMENPRMTFLTPTLLAGDRSLVDVVAHELAHSWTGNLVTNANMEHFWLNEGFTVWAERRILEALHGPEEAVLSWAVGQKSLEESLARFGTGSPLTRLRTELGGIDPDDAFSTVPYEKGARLLVLIERTAGRERFDRFVRDYMERFRFTSITTEEFLAFLDEKLPGVGAAVKVGEWLYQPDMPAEAPVFRSAALEALVALAQGWPAGARPSAETMARWSPVETLVYLQNLPRPLDAGSLAWLDQHLQLTGRGNHEILVAWLEIAAASDYEPTFVRLREVLTRVGRMKYLRPLYNALGKNERTRRLARDIFAAAAPTYHSLSRRVVASVLEKYPS